MKAWQKYTDLFFLFASLALIVASHVVNSNCAFSYYQSEVPEAAKKYRKF